MKRLGFAAVIAIVLGITLIGLSQTAPGLVQGGPVASTTPAPARVPEALRSSPVMFIENVGQFPNGARFQVRGGTGTMWLAEDAIWITVLERPHSSPRPPDSGHPSPLSQLWERGEGPGEWDEGRGVNLKLTFPGANPTRAWSPSSAWTP
jgi:hypothetical protein